MCKLLRAYLTLACYEEATPNLLDGLVTALKYPHREARQAGR